MRAFLQELPTGKHTGWPEVERYIKLENAPGKTQAPRGGTTLIIYQINHHLGWSQFEVRITCSDNYEQALPHHVSLNDPAHLIGNFPTDCKALWMGLLGGTVLVPFWGEKQGRM